MAQINREHEGEPANLPDSQPSECPSLYAIHGIYLNDSASGAVRFLKGDTKIISQFQSHFFGALKLIASSQESRLALLEGGVLDIFGGAELSGVVNFDTGIMELIKIYCGNFCPPNMVGKTWFYRLVNKPRLGTDWIGTYAPNDRRSQEAGQVACRLHLLHRDAQAITIFPPNRARAYPGIPELTPGQLQLLSNREEF